MTVPVNALNNWIGYLAPIVAGVPLSFARPVFDEDEIVVLYLDAAGAQQTAAIGTHYSVALAPPNYQSAQITPNATLVALLRAGTGLSIHRVLTYDQPLDITQNEALPEKEIVKAFDRAALRDQQLQEASDRTLRLPPVEAGTSFEIPAAAARANKTLAFDSAGVPVFASTPADVGAAVQEAAAHAADASTYAQAAAGYVQTISGVGGLLDQTKAARDTAVAAAAAAAASAASIGLPVLTTDGDMFYRAGGVIARLPAPTKAYSVLTAGATTGALAWKQNPFRPGAGTTTLPWSGAGAVGMINRKIASRQCAMITSDGLIKIWGYGASNSGPLNGNYGTAQIVPFDIGGSPVLPFTQVALVGGTGYALDSSGQVFAWGLNNVGQLAQGDTSDRLFGARINYFVTNSLVVARIVVPSCLDSQEFITNGTCAFFIMTDGSVYGVGNNTVGQLGDNTTVNKNLPVRCGTISGIVGMVVSGHGPYCSVYAWSAANGGLYSWGYNGYGQLGSGNTTNRSVPTLVTGLPASPVLDVKAMNGTDGATASYTCALALFANGAIYSAGYNAQGQLGDNTTVNKTVFTLAVAAGILFTELDISAGFNTACIARDTLGNAYVWGFNTNGYLGDGTTVNILKPKLLVGAYQGSVTAVMATGMQGNNRLYLVGFGSILWSCGYNGDGGLIQSANGASIAFWSPCKFGRPWNTVAMGYRLFGYANNAYFVLSRDVEGRAWHAGYNGESQAQIAGFTGVHDALGDISL